MEGVSVPERPNGGETEAQEPDHAAEIPPETDDHIQEAEPVRAESPAKSVAPILDGLERWLSRNGTMPPQ